MDMGSKVQIWEPQMLSIFRIMVGLLFLEHGTSKILGFPVTSQAQPAILSLGGASGLLELGGLLIALGLFTRPAAFILAGEMAVAYFLGHAPRGFFPILNFGDGAILYCFAFLYLFTAGGGAWSLDNIIARRSRGSAPAQ
jgi:putative oxidoreductase